jgi:alpha-D-ribose 1-methylphosphonate 5-triphosphate synthase subunit PhnH
MLVDAQADFRILLDSMARPGQLRHFSPRSLEAPSPLNPASAVVALTLLDSEVAHHAGAFPEAVSRYLAAKTGSPAAGPDAAAFVFLPNARHLEILAEARAGELAYPELGATVVLQLDALSATPIVNSMALTTTGPGVDGALTFHAAGVDSAFLTLLANRNAEFPLGLDLILTAGNTVVSLPRSQKLTWEGQ